jgi:NAD(P)-dependent dehydrogenase (short-subunit alcohol dehydrogenase family)
VNAVSRLMNLSGRTGLVTGAAGEMGRVFCDALLELGADVVAVDRGADALATWRRTLSSDAAARSRLLVCDLEKEDERAALIQGVLGSAAGLDILVNNAAFVGTSDLQGWGTAFELQSLDTWRRAVEVNLTAAFHLCQGLAPILAAKGRGSIINIGSIYGEFGPDWRLYDGTSMGNPAAYAASKGALLQLTRWLATTLAPKVRTNAICPGGVYRNQAPNFVQRYEARTPMQRMATEEDMVGALVYLSTDLSRYVTGQTLRVDGGWGVW